MHYPSDNKIRLRVRAARPWAKVWQNTPWRTRGALLGHGLGKPASAYARRALGPWDGKTRLGVRAARPWAMVWQKPPRRTRGAPLGHGMAKDALVYAKRALGQWDGKTSICVRAMPSYDHGMGKHASAYARRAFGPWESKHNPACPSFSFYNLFSAFSCILPLVGLISDLLSSKNAIFR